MNPGRDAIIIIAIVIGLAMVSTTLNSARNLKEQTFPEQETVQNNQTASIQKAEERERKDIGKELKEIEREVAQIQEDVEVAEANIGMSPYKGKIVIRRNLGPVKKTDIDKEYVLLEASGSNVESVNITDWRLESTITNRSVAIPEAIHLVFPGSAGSKLPVVLEPGDKAYIVTGRSPIGVSFRVNKCSGYYTQFQSFTPNISKKCPLPEDEILQYDRDTSIFIDNVCMDFVDRIRRCQVPTKTLPLNLSFACQDAIGETINYGSCIDYHKDDPDFKQPDWRIYLRRDLELWRDKNETIRLLDENGDEVDVFSY